MYSFKKQNYFVDDEVNLEVDDKKFARSVSLLDWLTLLNS